MGVLLEVMEGPLDPERSSFHALANNGESTESKGQRRLHVTQRLALISGSQALCFTTTPAFVACLRSLHVLRKLVSHLLQVPYLHYASYFLAAAAWVCCFVSFILPSLSTHPGHRQAPHHCKVSDKDLHFISHYPD